MPQTAIFLLSSNIEAKFNALWIRLAQASLECLPKIALRIFIDSVTICKYYHLSSRSLTHSIQSKLEKTGSLLAFGKYSAENKKAEARSGWQSDVRNFLSEILLYG